MDEFCNFGILKDMQENIYHLKEISSAMGLLADFTKLKLIMMELNIFVMEFIKEELATIMQLSLLLMIKTILNMSMNFILFNDRKYDRNKLTYHSPQFGDVALSSSAFDKESVKTLFI